jgi:hypothetical protein
MAEQVKIETPHVKVTYEDGSTIIVKTENPDMVFFDLERSKRNWPQGADAPLLWVNWLAYSKLRRTHVLERGVTFEDWLMTTQLIENVDSEGEPSELPVSVGPTSPDLEAAYSSS